MNGQVHKKAHQADYDRYVVKADGKFMRIQSKRCGKAEYVGRVQFCIQRQREQRAKAGLCTEPEEQWYYDKRQQGKPGGCNSCQESFVFLHGPENGGAKQPGQDGKRQAGGGMVCGESEGEGTESIDGAGKE